MNMFFSNSYKSIVGNKAVVTNRHYPFLSILHRVYKENLRGKYGRVTQKELTRHPELHNYCWVSPDLSVWIDCDGIDLFDTLKADGWFMR